MKNHKHLIQLIILTAALVACGAFAFKYLRTYKNIDGAHQSEQLQDTSLDRVEKEDLEQSPVDVSDEVVIQKENPNAQQGYCLPLNSKCSSSTKYCCRPMICSNSGYCSGN